MTPMCNVLVCECWQVGGLGDVWSAFAVLLFE